MTPPNKRQSLPPLPPFSPIPPAFVRRTRVFLFVENQSVATPPKLFLKIYKKNSKILARSLTMPLYL